MERGEGALVSIAAPFLNPRRIELEHAYALVGAVARWERHPQETVSNEISEEAKSKNHARNNLFPLIFVSI